LSQKKSNGAEPQMEAAVEVVTPAKAMEWLTTAARNRNISDSTVRRYGSDMVAERWRLNGQGIIFSAEGQLLDGRHRLTAVVATGLDVPMLIVRGAKDDSFETMDSGKGRTLANVLAIEGAKNAASTAATARIAWAYAAGVNLKYGSSRTELLNLIRTHPLIGEYTAQIVNRDAYTKPLGVPRSALAALLALANQERKLNDQVTGFLAGFITGEGLFGGDPRLTLRRWLSRQRADVGAGGGRIAEPFFAAAASAWGSFVLNEPMKNIRLPMYFNRGTVAISGFDQAQWGDVPDLSRFSFASLGPETPPAATDDQSAAPP
jgi:hypothetical protein